MQIKRVFLAIPIPVKIGAQLLQDFKKKNPFLTAPFVRPLLISQLHVTLYFFQRISDLKLMDLEHRLQSYLKNISVFELQISHIAKFPSTHSNIVAAYVELSQELKQLHDQIQTLVYQVELLFENCLSGEGMSVNHPVNYRPHITLCRLRDMNSFIIQEFNWDHRFKVKELVFYESKPTELGSEYIILKHFSLGI